MSRALARHALPDQAERDAAIRERARNVLIDAGAGTGKTTTLVRRMVQLLAPDDDALPALRIDRVAAITFTRKAAGELRLRVRERLLADLAAPGLSSVRAGRLRAALEGIDAAAVGTIHSFADRLLRQRPMEADLSPGYRILEDTSPLIDETTTILTRAAEARNLAEHLPPLPADLAPLVPEVEATFRLALAAAVQVRERRGDHHTAAGLDSLVEAFVNHRDQPPVPPPLSPPDLDSFRAVARELRARVAALPASDASGGRWLAELSERLGEIVEEDDPALVIRELRFLVGKKELDRIKQKQHFPGRKDPGWKLFKELRDAGDDGLSYAKRLRAPLESWLATRLVRTFPIVEQTYERLKARERVVDHLDLLLKLRDLLQDDAIRPHYQRQFDHLLVDEFQDTDPLQAEILIFLCAPLDHAGGDAWTVPRLRPGMLTLVGDPKQSIYRFRRADVAAYDRVRALVARDEHLPVRLRANFRSRAPLIDVLNRRFAAILGAPPSPDRLFDADEGRVFFQPLEPGRDAEPADAAALDVIPLVTAGERAKADEIRRLEAAALARYLRWLVGSGTTMPDPDGGAARPLRFGDVAILAMTTFNLRCLFAELDALDVPYVSRGGTLFLRDPLHRRFLLGARALSDPGDGVAAAALFSPPFFALAPRDLVAASLPDRSDEEGATRARQAHALISRLRRDRHARAPGDTLRDLLHATGFARTTARGPNGRSRVDRLHELVFFLEEKAAQDGLSFDALTQHARALVDAPVLRDPPHPVGGDTVEILTVHQAKGLEWPVVVLWDSSTRLDEPERQAAWRISPDRRAFCLTLEGLTCELPPGTQLARRDAAHENHENERLLYVAATRAREKLVVATSQYANKGQLLGRTLLGDETAGLTRLEPYDPATPPAWARAGEARVDPPSRPMPDEASIRREFDAAVAAAARPRLAPGSVTAHAAVEDGTLIATNAVAPPAPPDDGATATPAADRRPSRFGPTFGTVVHRAIGLALRGSAPDAARAVALTAAAAGLTEHVDDAVADVERSLAALAQLGISAPLGDHARLEYPLAAADNDATLLSGYADLVFERDGQLTIVDFKTDAPPSGPIERALPKYAEQLRAYARLLGRPDARLALLFSATGKLMPVAPTP